MTLIMLFITNHQLSLDGKMIIMRRDLMFSLLEDFWHAICRSGAGELYWWLWGYGVVRVCGGFDVLI